MTPEKTMLLITSPWLIQRKDGEEPIQIKSFSAIPISKDSPFVHIEYGADTKRLFVRSYVVEPTHVTAPKLDDNGDPARRKRSKNSDPEFKFERKLTEGNKLFHIYEEAEQIEFIKTYCVNADTFPFESFIKAAAILHEKLIPSGNPTMEISEAPAVDVPAGLSVVTE